MKYKRHNKILELINSRDIDTQEELTELLNREGYSVTQATVSRDIKEMGLVKVSSDRRGYKYAMPNSADNRTPQNKHMQSFAMAVTGVQCALHTVVVKTYSGTAQGVAALIDSTFPDKMLGSIAGDDTILIITESEKSAKEFSDCLKQMFM